jgi:hypothetical protein
MLDTLKKMARDKHSNFFAPSPVMKKESFVTLPVGLTCINIIKLFSCVTGTLYFEVLVPLETFQPSQEFMSEA